MSQIYRNMNQTGKYLFYQGTTFTLIGLLLLITNWHNMDAWGAASIAIGLSNLAAAQYDERCNVKKQLQRPTTR